MSFIIIIYLKKDIIYYTKLLMLNKFNIIFFLINKFNLIFLIYIKYIHLLIKKNYICNVPWII